MGVRGSFSTLLGAVGVGTSLQTLMAQSGVQGPAAAAAAPELVKMQIPGRHPGPAGGEAGSEVQQPVVRGPPGDAGGAHSLRSAALEDIWPPSSTPFFFLLPFLIGHCWDLGRQPSVHLVTLLNCPLVLIICRPILLDIVGRGFRCLQIMTDLSCPF